MGFPSLPRGLLLAQSFQANADRSHPGPTNGLESNGFLWETKAWSQDQLPRAPWDLQPGFAVSLAEAVRLSANFPWGFEVAHARGVYTGHNLDQIHIVDGGVADNTGIGTICHLVRSLRFLAGEEKPCNQSKIAKEIFEKLRDRGVFLIEIDSGAKEGKLTWFARRFPAINEPAHAMAKAGLVNDSFSKDMYLDDHINALLARFPRDVAFARQPLTLNHSENVMTAWALGPDDKAAVFVQFLYEMEVARSYLQDPTLTYNRLQQRAYLVGQLANLERREKVAKTPEEVQQILIERSDLRTQLETACGGVRRASAVMNWVAANRKRVYGQVQSTDAQATMELSDGDAQKLVPKLIRQ
jgi:hypothetical protein